MARSSYARFSIQEFYVFGMKTFLLIAHVEKEKNLKGCFKLEGAYRRNRRARRQEILVQGRTCFFQRRSGKRPPAKDHSCNSLSFRFSSTFQVTSTVK